MSAMVPVKVIEAVPLAPAVKLRPLVPESVIVALSLAARVTCTSNEPASGSETEIVANVLGVSSVPNWVPLGTLLTGGWLAVARAPAGAIAPSATIAHTANKAVLGRCARPRGRRAVKRVLSRPRIGRL